MILNIMNLSQLSLKELCYFHLQINLEILKRIWWVIPLLLLIIGFAFIWYMYPYIFKCKQKRN